MARAEQLKLRFGFHHHGDGARIPRPGGERAEDIRLRDGGLRSAHGFRHGRELRRQTREDARLFPLHLRERHLQAVAEAGDLRGLHEQRGAGRAGAEHDALNLDVGVGAHGQHVAAFALGPVVVGQHVGVTSYEPREPRSQLLLRFPDGAPCARELRRGAIRDVTVVLDAARELGTHRFQLFRRLQGPRELWPAVASAVRPSAQPARPLELPQHGGELHAGCYSAAVHPAEDRREVVARSRGRRGARLEGVQGFGSELAHAAGRGVRFRRAARAQACAARGAQAAAREVLEQPRPFQVVGALFVQRIRCGHGGAGYSEKPRGRHEIRTEGVPRRTNSPRPLRIERVRASFSE